MIFPFLFYNNYLLPNKIYAYFDEEIGRVGTFNDSKYLAFN